MRFRTNGTHQDFLFAHKKSRSAITQSDFILKVSLFKLCNNYFAKLTALVSRITVILT